jgi:hypothetical protein
MCLMLFTRAYIVRRFGEAVAERYAGPTGTIELSIDQLRTLRKATSRRLGLGDLVASVATPIARALRLPCIDPATKQLRPESGCAKRRDALNRLGKKPPL